MTLAFYLDEDAMRNSLLRALRSRGIDVTSAYDAGMIRGSDEEQLEVATQQGRVLYSFNVAHFCRIHTDWLSRNKSHAGIVLAHQQRYSVGTQLRGLQRLAMHFTTTEMRGRLEFHTFFLGGHSRGFVQERRTPPGATVRIVRDEQDEQTSAILEAEKLAG